MTRSGPGEAFTLRVSYVLALSATAGAAVAATPEVPTVHQLVARHVEARGGLGALAGSAR